MTWLLGNSTQHDAGSSARTLRRQHAWCWNVDPLIEVTGEVHDEVQLDGTYLTGGWCLLLAINGANGDVIAYQWCDEEKTIAWKALLTRIPPPRVAVIDGGRGLASALVPGHGRDPALQDGLAGGDVLADDDKAEVVETAERGQVRRAEGSVVHVEVFPMELV